MDGDTRPMLPLRMYAEVALLGLSGILLLLAVWRVPILWRQRRPRDKSTPSLLNAELLAAQTALQVHIFDLKFIGFSWVFAFLQKLV